MRIRNSFFALTAVCVLSAACKSSPPPTAAAASAPAPQAASASTTDEGPSEPADPFLWLEDIEGERQLAWVRKQNQRTLSELKSLPIYGEFYRDALSILTSKERIPLVKINGQAVDNFWQDESSVRGVWRRGKLSAYRRGRTEWTTVLDVDALAKTEGENWVFKTVDCLPPKYDRCMVNLSRGGTDAYVGREYVVSKNQFVNDGFVMPEGKNGRAWSDADNLLIASNWGGGLTDSGYPREVRVWKRGTPFSKAEKIFEGEKTDVWADPFVLRHGDDVVRLVRRSTSFYDHELYLWTPGSGMKTTKLPIPKRFDVYGLFNGQLILRLNQSFQVDAGELKPGTLVAHHVNKGTMRMIFTPSERQAIVDVHITESSLVVSLLDNVIGKAMRLRPGKNGWTSTTVDLPDQGVIKVPSASSSMDGFFVLFESLTQPQTLYYVNEKDKRLQVQTLPKYYDASDVKVEQRFAKSADGTQVPYFVLGRSDVLAKGPAPTIQYGYGGFLIPIRPVYYRDPSRPQHGALAGKLWVRRGGVLVLSNIRGGGEFGPRWHHAALKNKRQRAYEDFFAVSEDLIQRGTTTAEMLGAMGRSNGGLLMGVALTQRPDLYAAIDCGVPLFDMKRYSKLLAGASWMGEYGDPDVPEDWAYIQRYSPYQKLEAGRPYPRVFFYTSTKDDRVHPGHARKAVAKLTALDYPTYYYENIEGGHGGTANQDQLAMRTALEYTYFFKMLMNKGSEPAASTP